MRIAELAFQTGTTVRALRYYEDLGLIKPARTTGNARVYGPEARRAVRDIVALRRWGVSTDEVAKYYVLSTSNQEREDALKQLLQSRLRALDAQREELTEFLGQLQESSRTPMPS